MSAFPASERSSLRAPGTKGPSASRPAPSSARRHSLSFCLARLGAPAARLPGTPSLWIFLHTHHSPMTSCCGFLSLAPSPRNPGLFSNATGLFAGFSHRAGKTRVRKGARGGVWERKRERGTQSPADPTAAPSSLCKAAWDQRPTGWINNPPIPLPARLPPKATPSPQSAPKSR